MNDRQLRKTGLLAFALSSIIRILLIILVQQAPYKALYGTDLKVGLSSTSLPTEVLQTLLPSVLIQQKLQLNPEQRHLTQLC